MPGENSIFDSISKQAPATSNVPDKHKTMLGLDDLMGSPIKAYDLPNNSLGSDIINIDAKSIPELPKLLNAGMYDELGYNPFRNNEQVYYDKTSSLVNFGNSFGQFAGLGLQAFAAQLAKLEQVKQTFGTSSDNYLKDQKEFSDQLRNKYPVFKSFPSIVTQMAFCV